VQELIFISGLSIQMQVKSSRLVGFLNCTIWVLALALTPLSRASTLWTGPTIIYNQPAPDPTQGSNQDRITAVIWLTRAKSKGLFNAFSETSAGNLSPVDTEWAFGTMTNYTAVQYTNWLTLLNGASPTTLVGKQVMLHLISDDIYIPMEFTFWASGNTGGFTYQRATAPISLSAAGMSKGQFSFNYVALTNFTYVIQYSYDLTGWESLATNVATTNTMTFFEPMDSPGKFYRVICPPNL
jgi:hypothetical protein